MDFLFNNLDLLKAFTVSLIKLDVDKELSLKMMYHIYNVHQSTKCNITNLLFPESKQTCDEIIAELEEEEDEQVTNFVAQLKHKFTSEPFDKDVDAVTVARKTFVEINQKCKPFKEISYLSSHLSSDEFHILQNFEKEQILYKCMDSKQKEFYFHHKQIKPGFRRKLKHIYESLETKCPVDLYHQISKKKKYDPVIWIIRRKHGDEIIFACGDQRKKMDFILTLLQKIYL
jgi:hypothetical protein